MTAKITVHHSVKAMNRLARTGARSDESVLQFNWLPDIPGPPFVKVSPICTNSAVPIVPARKYKLEM